MKPLEEEEPGGSLPKTHSKKRIKIAFLYNVRHKQPAVDNPGLDIDFDDPENIAAILKNLKINFDVIPIEADEQCYSKLLKHKKEIDFVFNFAEGIYGKCREAHIPAMLEMLQLPFTGPSSTTCGIILDKKRTKEILIANNIATAKYQVFSSSKEKLQSHLKFPLIVKPIAQGSSAGVTNASLVKNQKELTKQINYVIKNFHQEALVEEFLPGREFSVPMIGNPPQIFPMIEPVHEKLPKGYSHIDSLEVKWIYEYEAEKEGADSTGHFICPAKVSPTLKKKINDLLLRTWKAMELKDWCRIDLRLNKKGEPNIIEINCPVGVMPPEITRFSYLPWSARVAKINYPDLLKKIILTSYKRYAKNN